MRLLVTRPEPDATRTAETLRARGHDVLVAPLLATPTIAAELAGLYAGVLMTSANAARAVTAHPRRRELTRLPCFAVGARTAEAAQAAGFTDTISADGALGDLVDLVAAKVDRSARLLYLAGEDRAGDLAGDLAQRGITVETAVIYRAVAAEKLPPHLIGLAGEHAGRRAALLAAQRRDLARARRTLWCHERRGEPRPLLPVRRRGGSAAGGGRKPHRGCGAAR